MKKFFLFLLFVISFTVSYAQVATTQRIKQSSNTVIATSNKQIAPSSTPTLKTQSSSKSVQAKALEPIRHYTNNQGQIVQSPTLYSSVPEGATALCKDGTYSFSKNRCGTCSHHGGVAKWLK